MENFKFSIKDCVEGENDGFNRRAKLADCTTHLRHLTHIVQRDLAIVFVLLLEGCFLSHPF